MRSLEFQNCMTRHLARQRFH